MRRLFKSSRIRRLTAGLVAALSAAFFLTVRPIFAQAVTVDDRPAIGLILLDNLMSGRSQVGDTVHYETLANVYDDNKNLLIPAGCLAIGHVTRSKGSGMFGKRGELNFSCRYVVLPDGTHVPLVGSKIKTAGTNDTAETAAVTILATPLGLFIKGGTVKVNAGTPVEMYVADGDVINPAPQPPPAIHADFSLKGKNSTDVVGAIQGFDGDSYDVASDSGDQQVALSNISNITLKDPPVMETSGN
jgi:hypothetical protein